MPLGASLVRLNRLDVPTYRKEVIYHILRLK